ncbi:hypothetical protein BU251_06385 [Candidatus Velamenicoccus archaeovorus]|uniref:Uncharacterized protein n=1 Tax=Velamenicoccus archaeovorus TaxID=1930593 RepID=A0A410P5B5_VELA1|nr:hypothetical protein [Candidatus Velamenicoccus archaeovorus]QAT17376.1 hypothetical protein BU251_06385 [Candidatus Velamenicoccus archaeovorus]
MSRRDFSPSQEERRIAEDFRRIAATVPLPDSHKLFILQVYGGLKPSGTFDGLPQTDMTAIRNLAVLLKRLFLYYRVLRLGKNVKIIFSRRRQDVERLFDIHDGVFRRRRHVREYGRLLGYPSCCVARFRAQGNPWSFICDVEDYLGRFPSSSYASRLYWQPDARLNRYAGHPLIFHWPCRLDCPSSIELADKVLSFYESYRPGLAQKLMSGLAAPVLVFRSGNYVRFSVSMRRGTIRYAAVNCVTPLLLETGALGPEDEKVLRIMRTIEAGNRISFNGRSFTVCLNGRSILEVNFSDRFFCFLDFNPPAGIPRSRRPAPPSAGQGQGRRCPPLKIGGSA